MHTVARYLCILMQAYVQSQRASLQPSQPPGPAEDGTAAAAGGPQEPAEEGSSKVEAQKLRRELLSQLLSKVQSSAALLVEPLLDAGGPVSSLCMHFCSVSICRRVAASQKKLLVMPDTWAQRTALCRTKLHQASFTILCTGNGSFNL